MWIINWTTSQLICHVLGQNNFMWTFREARRRATCMCTWSTLVGNPPPPHWTAQPSDSTRVINLICLTCVISCCCVKQLPKVSMYKLTNKTSKDIWILFSHANWQSVNDYLACQFVYLLHSRLVHHAKTYAELNLGAYTAAISNNDKQPTSKCTSPSPPAGKSRGSRQAALFDWSGRYGKCHKVAIIRKWNLQYSKHSDNIWFQMETSSSTWGRTTRECWSPLVEVVVPRRSISTSLPWSHSTRTSTFTFQVQIRGAIQ